MIDLKNKKYFPHVCIAVLTILTCMGIYFCTSHYKVTVDGKTVGVVSDKKEITDIVDSVTDKIKKDYNKDVTIQETINYTRIMSSEDNLTQEDELKQNLLNTVTLNVDATSIKVEGKDEVFVKDEKVANKVLNDIKNLYPHEDNAKTSFVEKVDLENKNVNISQVKTEEEARNFLLTGNDTVEKYTVKDGDSVWAIARDHDMRVKDIQEANKDIDVEKIKPGEQINLAITKPILDVKSVETVEYDKPIPFETVLEDTEDLFKGDKKVKLDGIEGCVGVKSEVVKINGVWKSEKILQEEVKAQPQNKIILNGTKDKPSYVASGAFSNPTRGTLSSRFGKRWGKGHDGIDIAGPIGTPIYAADAGVVEYAGVMNGYGNIIIINHQNGYKTYYGHCSSLVAKKGQKVAKGDLVAKMGNTGKSTGSHLHFEVRKNNVPINPLEYVKY